MLKSLVVLLAGAFALASSQSTKAIQIEMKNADGKVVGKAELTEAVTEKGVRVRIDVRGLAPGKHGIHFHETGKCEGPDFKSAGSHFSPSKKLHGLENPKGSHAGDLPNLEVSKDGTAKTEFTAPYASIGKDKNSLLKSGGTALVIHEKVDDQKTDPSGDSGDRIVCGVIGG